MLRGNGSAARFLSGKGSPSIADGGNRAGERRKNIEISIYHLLEGAREARGLTVIIDVFRAFSLECYLYRMGASEVRPVGLLEEALSFRRKWEDCVLIGERHGSKCEGFDFGNSPSRITPEDVAGKIIIHTTSAGTQGIVNAAYADELLTGSLVNAKAIAQYILKRQPEQVSLVCMGNSGTRPAAEDELCAEYIKSLLLGQEMPDIEERIADLQFHGGEHFFDPEKQEAFPQPDFWLCIRKNQFPFVLLVEKDEHGFISRLHPV